MVNSWSLLDSELNGTMNKDFPIKEEYDIPKQDSAYPHSTSWYEYKRNNPDAKNPFTDPVDREYAEYIYESPDGGKTVTRRKFGEDYTKRELVDTYKPPAPFVPHSLNNEVVNKESMAHYFKYHEEEILKDIEEYVSSTYRGHYTGDTHEYRNVQTLDLMAARSVASGFCQANILKYGSRYGSKDGKNKKDLLKVIHYAMLLLHFDDHYGKPSMPSGNFEQMP